MVKNPENKFFNIQMASAASGISAHTIRAWEKRYQALCPMRTETGKRMYTEAEVERLKTLSLLVNLGSSISQIAALPDEELLLILQKLNHTKEKYSSRPVSSEAISPMQLRDKLMESLHEYDMESLTGALKTGTCSLDQQQLVFEIFVPLLEEARKQLASGNLKEAQLQTLESLIRFHAASCVESPHERQRLSKKKFFIPRPQGSDAIFCVLSSLLCSYHQLNFFYSHIGLPLDAIIETALSLDASVVILHGNVSGIEALTLPSSLEIWSENPLPNLARHTHFANLQELNHLLKEVT